jgi:signal transduction histidine kinase
VARAQAYAMLELSQAGVLFLDREHKLMGEASAAAPELLGHTCGAGTAFVQVIAELVDVKIRRETVAFLESMWKAEPSTTVDATQNPLARVHSGSRHLGIRFSRMVLDGRVHHIIVSIERIAAPRIVPHTIEVPALNEDTFARRLAGETGTRPALVVDAPAAATGPETGAAEQFAVPAVIPAPPPAAVAVSIATPVMPALAPVPAPAAVEVPPIRATVHELPLAALDITDDSLPVIRASAPVPPVSFVPATAPVPPTPADGKSPTNENFILSLPPLEPQSQATLSPLPVGSPEISPDLATTITSPETAREAVRQGPIEPDPSSIIDPPDPRLSEVLKEILRVERSRLDNFLGEARDKAGQLRAILKLPARDPQAFREKLVLILELIRGIHARAKRMPLQSVCDRAERFEEALGKLRDKQTLSGNDFLPLAVKLDDLLSHMAIQAEVLTRLREWRTQNGLSDSVSIDTTQRSTTMTGTTIRQPRLKKPGEDSHPGSETQKAKRLSDLSQDSLEEMAQFLADMYSKRVSLVCVGLEDVPGHYRRTVEKILGQLIHNAIRHGLEAPADRVVLDKPEIGTVAVQFLRVGADGYQLSVQDDGRGLDHDKIRAEAVRQGVFSAEAAAKMDPRKLASLIFRPGFTTAGEGVRGIGMDVVRDLVNKAGGKVGIATKPGEYTRIRVALPHEKNASGAAVA